MNFLIQKRLACESLPVTLVFSDASDIAVGAFTVETNEKVFHKAWSKHECAQSSTWRELKAIQLALKSYACSFVGKSLLWHTDNQNCVKLVQRGSTKITSPKLSAVYFFKVC